MVAKQFKCTYNLYRKLTEWHTGDADDSGESSPPTSMSTMSLAPLSAGADMALSGQLARIERKWCAVKRPARMER